MNRTLLENSETPVNQQFLNNPNNPDTPKLPPEDVLAAPTSEVARADQAVEADYIRKLRSRLRQLKAQAVKLQTRFRNFFSTFFSLPILSKLTESREQLGE